MSANAQFVIPAKDEPIGPEEPIHFSPGGTVLHPPRIIWRPPFSTAALNGSWLLNISTPTTTVCGQTLHTVVSGPLRIEVGDKLLRLSGDVYSWPPGSHPPAGSIIPSDAGSDGSPPSQLVFPIGAWYPVFPKARYSWYFRSHGATYQTGTLTVNIVRHVWNPTAQEFEPATNSGTLTLKAHSTPFIVPPKLPLLTGTLVLGDMTLDVQAIKTSSMFRSCRVEVDAMVHRNFPASATIGSGALVTFQSIYATAGWDVTVVPDEINIPEDLDLSNSDLEGLLTTHKQAYTGQQWRLWLLVGSSQGSLFGVMFDDDEVPREGAVGFADVRLPNAPIIDSNARGQPLGNVPAAFLRTLVHEAGHAFNLFHPKHDVHHPPIGIEVMNQTGDVMNFATEAKPYPTNAAFRFAEHDLVSLRHSPDPQVRPGWKKFGWGHGDLSAGLPTPVDVAGLNNSSSDPDGLELTLAMSDVAFIGEYVMAEVTLTNKGRAARNVSGSLNLAEGDLLLQRTTPAGRVDNVLDVVVGCRPRPIVNLEPGQSISGQFQVFFTNKGVTFDTPGRHLLSARAEVNALTCVTSNTVAINLRSPATPDEVSVHATTLRPGVGRAFALGDFGNNSAVATLLTDLAEAQAASTTGAASALVLANAFSRRYKSPATLPWTRRSTL